ncbi:MAG: YbaK/EbsC family protein [Proteobacteria bacterium]|nr:YbaK/EbsC family protein [Pseudomonadota bacterium]
MPSKNLTDFLNERKVHFTTVTHTPAYTAQEIAASAHIPGTKIAKSVVVRIDGKLCILVEPANCKVDLKALQTELGAHSVELAHEYEFEDSFPGCETGAVPPMGELFDVDVYVDDVIKYQDEIVFSAGNHHELIKMRYADFEKLVKPKHVHLH